MKSLILPAIMLIVSIASAQRVIKIKRASDHSTYVHGDKFEGVIFTKDYDSGAYINKRNKEFTPTINEIILAEKLLYKNLDTINNKWASSVHKNLKTYLRQYFGYINVNGERIIYIYAFRKKDLPELRKQWLQNLIMVEDGGDNYWQIEINLNTKKLLSFGINSVG